MKYLKIRAKLLDFFRDNKNNLIKPYKEIKSELLKCPDELLELNYSVHIQDLKFYGII